ncbi:16S rRNA (cytosine(1402)-N(4))-methyltransferase [Candidatus Kaiserbacteria bacterium CG10_big_fil_rev_8_21_14_0_10_45_20]|uniref:Ribosomal RNA small subunit methyltransferase H n=1 Tax=Candidatus Kaiserbacteria bacterium CG10_big_fil_rev_8_21_14_0_10_45_20 TaxID=1974607 RepID=A0A2H0UGC2_9BACT|nr:MAG: 16S rRNA (cytosine(1402)-N(4))-methyltransferase [Candidatus Kaiserbacteria bacterium CG10_big_fil_rev_8_21_14_0_10_45_20]
MNNELQHTTVLLHESVQALHLTEGDTVVDGTVGLGGHTHLLCEVVGKTGTVLGIDADSDAIAKTKQRFLEAEAPCSLRLAVGNFRDIQEIASSEGIRDPQGILFDLGWNSTQLQSGRGFSFLSHDPLLMTFSKEVEEGATTAETIVNTWSQVDLAESIKVLGEERFAERIASAIVARRRIAPFTTADDLAETIGTATPPWYRTGRINPATKTFQALRILVNDELSSLQEGMKNAFSVLRPQGRLAIITFHSLEDGMVKRYFRTLSKEGKAVLIVKKPIRPSEEEVQRNPRSRSAKLRIIEKI